MSELPRFIAAGSLSSVLIVVLSGSLFGAAQEGASLSAVIQEASTAWRAGEARKALPLWEQATKMAAREGETIVLARALVGLGWARWATGQYDAALETHERALGLFRDHDDAAGESEALLRLGETLFSMGRYAEALSRYEAALIANTRAPDRLREALIRSSQGSVLRFIGRYDDAVQAIDSAYAIFESLGNDPGMAQALTFLGIVNRARSEYSKAVEAYTAAIALRRKTGDRRGESQALGNLGNVYRDLGQYERAIEAYTRSAAIAEEIGYAAQIGFSHQSLGGLLAQLGRPDEALARFERALAIWRNIDRKPQIGWTLREIGIQRLYARKDLDGARTAFADALEIGRTIGEPEMVANLTFDLGDVAMQSGAHQEGLALFEEALAGARRIGSPNLEYEVLAERGRAYLRMDRPEDGIADLRASIAIVNDLRARVTSDSSKISFLDTRQQVFHDLVAALADAGRSGEALEAAEAARARALADLLHGRELRIGAADQPALDDLRAAVTASAHLTRAPDDSRGSTDVSGALDRIRSRNPELASLVAVESPRLEEVRATAARLTAAVLEYFVTDRAVFAWVIAPDGSVNHARIEISSSELEALVRTTVLALDEAPAADLQKGRGPHAQLRKLYATLVAPLHQWLPRDRPLVIVPHGPLAYLPFAALEDSDGTPLIERHALAFAPSAAVYRYTSQKRRTLRGTALVIAAPAVPAESGLPVLAGALDEGRRITARLAALRPTHLTGGRASERAAKAQIATAAVVHFATHGLVSETRPLDSSLVLADGDGEDGYLRVSEVFGLDLQASLVVLSGCSTGRGRLTGDGIFGLTRAFMYAGTPSVVVSLWDVSDRATAFLMDRFYAHLTRTGDKAGALRSAQLATRERYPHPALWAPFILVGEPR